MCPSGCSMRKRMQTCAITQRLYVHTVTARTTIPKRVTTWFSAAAASGSRMFRLTVPKKWRMTLWSPSSLSIFRKRWIFKRHTLRVIWRINTMLMRITASTVQTSESNVPLRKLLLQPLKATQVCGKKQAAFSCITARQNMRFIPFGF